MSNEVDHHKEAGTPGVEMSIVHDTESDEWFVVAECADGDTLSIESCWKVMFRPSRTSEVFCEFHDDLAYFQFENEHLARSWFPLLKANVRVIA